MEIFVGKCFYLDLLYLKPRERKRDRKRADKEECDCECGSGHRQKFNDKVINYLKYTMKSQG